MAFTGFGWFVFLGLGVLGYFALFYRKPYVMGVDNGIKRHTTKDTKGLPPEALYATGTTDPEYFYTDVI